MTAVLAPPKASARPAEGSSAPGDGHAGDIHAGATVGRTWLPDAAPLAMPVQDFSQGPKSPAPVEHRWAECDYWRGLAFGLTLVAMVCAGVPTREVLQVGGFTPLEMLAFVLFEILFGWVVFSLTITLSGVASSIAQEPEIAELKSETPLPVLAARSAILMPIYNEDPDQVFDRLRAMDRSLRDLGRHEAFDLFVLSDTRSPEIVRVEQAAFERLHDEIGARAYYRRRAFNTARKAGNIHDWVVRFGGAYDFMVVLDADSLMGGETLARLAGAMQAHPEIGLLQTAPRLHGRTSLFGRLQQFASTLYGPTMTNGLSLLWGSEGNYWGHNAIIRTCAFAEQAGLPVLRGRKPFGGEIMSHDFVEAALMRRAGWQIRIAPRMTGSYEECPPTLPDMIVRDRRWCQGNVQHLNVVATKGLHWMNRFHLIQGALGYFMSPLWLVFMVVSALIAMQSRVSADGEWDMYGIRVLSWVLATTFFCLFLPRVIAVGMTLSKGAERRQWGNPVKLVVSVLLETLASALVAPIMMLSQSRALFDILLGRDSGWSAQSRADGSIVWGAAWKRFWRHGLFGLALGAFLYWISPQTFWWALPVVVGLLVAVPMTVWSASPAIGARFLRWGLFMTPEEIANPPRLPATDKESQAHEGVYGPQVKVTG